MSSESGIHKRIVPLSGSVYDLLIQESGSLLIGLTGVR